MPRPVLWPQQPQGTLQAWGRNGPGSIGQHLDKHEPAACLGSQEAQWHPGLHPKYGCQQEQRGDHLPVLRSCEAAFQVLCSVLGLWLQDRH